MNLPENIPDIPPVKKGKGCFGCFGCVGQLAVIFVLAGVLYLATIAVFAPWGYFLGGKFHILPYWQGWGRLHSKISGDYVIYVRIDPSPGGMNGAHLSTYVDGNGYICTPRGERIWLNVIGSMRRHLNVSTNGEAIGIKLYHRTPFWGNFNAERRPRIELHGHWQNSQLIMDDDGSISRSFGNDGSVYLGNASNRPYKQEVVPVTLNEGSYSEFQSACASIH